MNRILESWQKAGWRTPEQVRAEDRPARQSAAKTAPKQDSDYQPSRERIRKNDDFLDRFLEGQKKGT